MTTIWSRLIPTPMTPTLLWNGIVSCAMSMASKKWIQTVKMGIFAQGVMMVRFSIQARTLMHPTPTATFRVGPRPTFILL